jgi:hypothetical protein
LYISSFIGRGFILFAVAEQLTIGRKIAEFMIILLKKYERKKGY